MLDKLSRGILIYCIVPFLSDTEKRSLSATSKRMFEVVDRHCLEDKRSLIDLCLEEELLTIYKRKLTIKSQDEFDVACVKGYINLVKNPNFIYIRSGLSYACLSGQLKIVNLIISLTKQGLDWNTCMYNACRKGNRDIIDLIAASSSQYDYIWNTGLAGACEGGHREIVDLMIEKGATAGVNGLESACRGGHREIVNLMIERFELCKFFSHLGLSGACGGGHREIADLMISIMDDNNINVEWDSCFIYSCIGGHQDMIDFTGKFLTINEISRRNLELAYACKHGRYRIANRLAENRPDKNYLKTVGPYWENYYHIIKNAVEKGAKECGHCGKSPQDHLQI